MAGQQTTTRRRWERDETLAALALYCQIPFGKMHANNPAVQTLAQRIDRSANSVALKLVNFASLDPAHQKRGIRGMGNTSALDREVWDAYFGQWEVLAAHALSMPADTDEFAVEYAADDAADAMTPPAGPTERSATVTVRRGQRFFRAAVTAAYGYRCCITGIRDPALLRASHIVPWAVDASLRLAPTNGLSLNPLHDAAFDRGLLTLDEDLRVRLAPRLVGTMPAVTYDTHFARYANQPIEIPERFAPDVEYLAWHREHVFART